jgi:tRNA A58 N-methylase Trm61
VKTAIPHLLITAFVIALAAPRAGVAQEAASADAERLVKTLEIRAGSTVAEIGAGTGELTVLMARAVGESGRIYGSFTPGL